MEPHRLHRRSERGIPPRLGQRKAGGASRAERRHGRDGNDLTAERRYAAMRSVEMKNRCLLYYGNPVGYRTEQGVVADSMFRREELEDWLARKGLAVRWEDGIYDRLSSGGYQKAADNGPALKSCRIWQLGPSAPAAMRFIGLDRMSVNMADLTLPVTRQCLTALSAPTVWMGSGRHSVAGPWAATDSRWPSQTLSNSTTIPAASSTMWTAQLSSPSN